MPSNYLGHWKSKKQKITSRVNIGFMKYNFFSDSIIAEMNIQKNNKVSGKIGMATFNNAEINKNYGCDKITGIRYIIKCGTIGKLFPNDPLLDKEVELWMMPSDSLIRVELRLKNSFDVFPMGELSFNKE